MRQHNRLSVFLGLSLLTHTVFIVSTGFFSLNDKAELPIRVKLIEIPSPEKKEHFPVNSSSHSSIKHHKGITSQKINNKTVELSSEPSNTIKKQEKIIQLKVFIQNQRQHLKRKFVMQFPLILKNPNTVHILIL